jgi:hypothetical protein
MKKTIFILSVFTILGSVSLNAQLLQVTDVSGGTGKAGSTAIAWSIGELAISSLESGNVMLTQGYLQPVLVATAIDEKDGLPFTLTVYPNPAREWIEVRLYEADWKDFTFQLQDVSGRLLCKVIPQGNTTRIPMTQYGAGLYLLKALQSDKESVVLEIVKP